MRQDDIAALASSVLASHGLELDALEVLPAGRRRLLRVVVDGDGPRGRGPLLDDIAEATTALSAALDASDLTGSAPYTLEVSSRGVSRPLTAPRHWRRNAGRLVAVTLADGTALTGRVQSLVEDEQQVRLEVDGAEREVALDEVRSAVVQVELNRPRSLDSAGEGTGDADDAGDDDGADEDEDHDDEDVDTEDEDEDR